MRVAIIGAGICGLYLSWKLSERGEQVTVFERKKRIGKEVCSGLFSERILDFIPESQKLIQNRITSALIHFPKKTLRIEFSKKFLVMDHFKLDNVVADLAKGAGAKLTLGYIVSKEDIIRFQTDFDRVIGCDGAGSFVRQSLNLSKPDFRTGIQGFKPENADSKDEKRADFVETWPTKSGFLWKIPRKTPIGNEIEYGIIEKGRVAKELFEEFLKKNNLDLERVRSAIVPQGFIVPSNSKITLCGDSAGLTKPWSGGGVVWSLISANLLLENFPDFLRYRKEIRKIFLPKILFSKFITKVVYFLGFKVPYLLPKNIKIESDFLI